jgi:Tol biopolymer transport system component/uncharacterized protein YjdB
MLDTMHKTVRLSLLGTFGAIALMAPRSGRAQQVADVQLAPVTVAMVVGETRELLATAYDARGDNISTARFVWTSSNPTVVRVEADPSVPGIAKIVGLSQGLASVEARAGGHAMAAAVQVSGGGVAPGTGAVGVGAATVLQIEPGSVFLLPTEDVDLKARFLKDDGSPAAPSQVTWRSLRADVATVSPQGSVVGLTPGQGVIEAVSAGGLVARVTVQVSQTPFQFEQELVAVSPGLSDTVRVVVPDQNHRRLEPRRLAWRSTDVSVASVSPLGVVTGIRAGTAEIVVTGYAQENRVPVTVHRAVEILDLSPRPSDGPVPVPLGGSIPFTAIALAADETPVPEAPLTWSLPDTTVAAFDPVSRSLKGKSLGETELKVRAPGEGLEATWQIKVIEGGLALEREELTLSRNEQRPIQASFTDETGAPVSAASGVTWTSSDPSVVEVSDEGVLSAKGFGTAQVFVSTPWGSADSATVYVQGDVLVTYTTGDSTDLYSFDRDEPSQLHRVTSEPGSEVDAQFSPDGTRIVYATDQAGNLDIVVAKADGSDPTRLVSTVYEEHSPCWTPDGTQIVYESDFGSTPQIWIMNADGSDQRQLTHDEWWSREPVVSPNGSTIAYLVTRDKKTDVYLMDLDGTNQRNFTTSEANEDLPAWVGDSSLAYLAEERQNRTSTWVVTQMNFMREVKRLSPEGLPVVDFAVSRDGETLGVIVSTEGPGGQENRLYLIPLVGDGTAVEVPRASQGDQMFTPSFRR